LKRLNKILGVVIIGICWILYQQTLKIPSEGARTFPQLMLLIIGIGAVLIIVANISKKNENKEDEKLNPIPWIIWMITVLMFLSYILLIPIMGFYVSSFFLVLSYAMVLQKRNYGKISIFRIVPASMTVIIALFLIFNMLFHLRLPTGVFF